MGWGGSRGDGGWGRMSGPQEGDVSLQALDGGLVGLCALEESVRAGRCRKNLPEVVGTSSECRELAPPGDGEGGLGGDASFREDGLRKCRRGGGWWPGVETTWYSRSGSTSIET